MVRVAPCGLPAALVLVVAVVIGCEDGERPAPPPTAASATEEVAGAAIEFTVCVDNRTWTRPSPEEQRARLERDPRYPVDASILAWFDAHFIRYFGSASEDRKYGWAGIWSEDRVPFEVEGPCAQPYGIPNPVAVGDIVELWLLNYETGAVRTTTRSGLTVEVRPRDPGYQVIHFPNPMQERGTAWGLIRFADEQGTEIARIGPGEMQAQIGRASETE